MRTIIAFGIVSYISKNVGVSTLDDMSGGFHIFVFILVAIAQDIKELIK